MDCDRISQFQFIQQIVWIFYLLLFIIFDHHGLFICIDLFDDPHIPVKYTDPFIDRHSVPGGDLPLKLVIILDLHHLIPLTEQMISIFFFLFARLRRIQIFLQDLIDPFHSEQSLSHRRQNLNVCF